MIFVCHNYAICDDVESNSILSNKAADDLIDLYVCLLHGYNQGTYLLNGLSAYRDISKKDFTKSTTAITKNNITDMYYETMEGQVYYYRKFEIETIVNWTYSIEWQCFTSYPITLSG